MEKTDRNEMKLGDFDHQCASHVIEKQRLGSITRRDEQGMPGNFLVDEEQPTILETNGTTIGDDRH
jgi:hypothetical protein